MLSLATGRAQWESEKEVNDDILSELWLRLRLQSLLLLRRLSNNDGGKPPGRLAVNSHSGPKSLNTPITERTFVSVAIMSRS